MSTSERKVAMAQERPTRRLASWISLDVLFVPIILVIAIVILSFASPYFLTGRNLAEVLLAVATLGIAAVGATFVIIDGDLDLSLGANVALSGVVTAVAMVVWFPGNWIAGMILGVLTGVAVGLVNGLLSTFLRVPAFITTLGTGVIAGGLAIYMTNGLTVSGLPDAFQAIATTPILGLQSLVWFMLLTFIVGAFVLHRTNFGLRTFATGGNREAAFLAGIPVTGIRIGNFMVAGFCGGFAGMLLTSRVQAGQPGISTTLTLYATAAVILGGTSILGGQGSVVRTFFGILLIGVVQNGLDLLRVDYSLQQVVVGAVFVLAAASEAIRRRR